MGNESCVVRHSKIAETNVRFGVITAGLVAGDNHLNVRLAPKATKAGAAD
jgi:hypothetical protein